MKHDHYCFHVSKSSEDQKKGLQEKFKEFLSPKLSEDQKKTFSPKIEEFLSSKASEDQKKVQRSSSAQMHTIVKLLGGIYPPRVSAPLFSTI